jgi:hypothetical protein
MSKRLQVLFEDPEYRELQMIARKNRMTVSEWVRHALCAARRREPSVAPDRKLAVVRAAVRHEFPTADVDQLLHEIERGYLDEGTE